MSWSALNDSGVIVEFPGHAHLPFSLHAGGINKKINVSMIRKYHNHKLQTNPWHGEEEPQNTHETSGRETKQSNQLSLSHQDDCKTRMDTKLRTTKQRTIKESHNWSNNQQPINNNRTTTLERTVPKATWGLKCSLLVPNLRPRFYCC